LDATSAFAAERQVVSQKYGSEVAAMNPSDVFVDQYRIAAGEGAVLELKMRLLANKVPALRPYLDEKLEEVEEQIIALFGKELQGNEPEQLGLCRQLRNKVLHCDFPKARSKLHELGAPQVRGGVREIRITDPTPGGLVQHLTDAAAGTPGSFRHVADLTSKTEVNVFDWLLELGTAGDFGRAAEIFRVACGIVDRLVGAADHLPEQTNDATAPLVSG
jgi:hypothetical protein